MQDFKINNDKIDITLKMSLIKTFEEKVSREMREVNCTYFTHQIIQNYRKKGHRVSSFYTNPDWQKKYWQDYWNCDPLEREIHQIAETDGFVISSWDCVDPNSDVMQQRKTLCHLDDGVYFTIRHDNGLFENFSFGWGKDDKDQMDFEKLMKLSSLVNDFRNDHLKLFEGDTPNNTPDAVS